MTFQIHPYRLTLALPLVLAASLLTGCLYGELASPTRTETPAPATAGGSKGTPDAPIEPALEPSITPLSTLVSQTVQWFDKDVSVTSAETRVVQEEDYYGDVHFRRTHIVTVRVQNRTGLETGHGSHHFDLFLQDGTRLQAELDSSDYGPHDARSFALEYDDDSARTLEGAHLELNGSTYGDYAPLQLPLDKTMAPEVRLNIVELVGQVFTCDAELADDCWTHEVLSARVVMSSDIGYHEANGARAWPGKKLFELQVRTTGSHTTNLFEDVFHLNVNGIGVSNDRYINELPRAKEPTDVAVVFQVDEAAEAFEVEFDTEGNPNNFAWKTFHVDLSKATPAP